MLRELKERPDAEVKEEEAIEEEARAIKKLQLQKQQEQQQQKQVVIEQAQDALIEFGDSTDDSSDNSEAFPYPPSAPAPPPPSTAAAENKDEPAKKKDDAVVTSDEVREFVRRQESRERKPYPECQAEERPTPPERPRPPRLSRSESVDEGDPETAEEEEEEMPEARVGKRNPKLYQLVALSQEGGGSFWWDSVDATAYKEEEDLDEGYFLEDEFDDAVSVRVVRDEDDEEDQGVSILMF